MPGPLAAGLSHSVVYSRVFGLDRRPDAFDLARYCAVVQTAVHGLRRLYPRLEFLVIVWPDLSDPVRDRVKNVTAMVGALRALQLRTVTANDLQPGFDAAPLPFLIALDGHPNALMHAQLARALLTRDPVLRHVSANVENDTAKR